MHISFRKSSVCAVVLIALLTSTVARAAAINYGNILNVPPGVSFFNITESSSTDTVPLFGAPSSFTTGLDFDPTSFGASSTGGANDITDGQLNFGLEGEFSDSKIVAIDSLSLFESGDYSLFGSGTSLTQVGAGASIKVTVTEIDGVAVAPINLAPTNASVGFNLVANPGMLQPWSIGASVNIAAQLTGLLGPGGFTYGATAIEVVIDDNLIALSEANSAAFIAKKDFQVSLEGDVTIVPEPASLSLLALGALGMLTRRRRGC